LSLDIFGRLWTSLDVFGSLWKSLEVFGRFDSAAICLSVRRSLTLFVQQDLRPTPTYDSQFSDEDTASKITHVSYTIVIVAAFKNQVINHTIMESPSEFFRTCVDAVERLFTTPLNEWTWGQFFLALVLLSLAMSCCGSVGRRRYRRSYSEGRDTTNDNDGDHQRNTTTTSSTSPYHLAEEQQKQQHV
jgi:hypothetical protein